MNTGVPATSGLLGRQRASPYPRPAILASNAADAPGHARQRPRPLITHSRSGSASTTHIVTLPKEQVPVNDLVQLARKAFSIKDFVTAFHYLTRALTIAPKDINLLDSRAASLEKIGRWEDALADAKSMIRNQPQNPKGYLRAGKVLRLQQNFKSSAKIFIAGAERCDKESKEYEALVRIATDMRTKVDEIAKAWIPSALAAITERHWRETRVLDPMERLPFELVMVVFDSLSFTERVRCLIISKRWMAYLGSVRHFWHSIDLAKRIPSPVRTPRHALYLPALPDQEPNNKVTNKTVLSLVKYTPPKVLRLGCAQQVSSGLLTQLSKMKRTTALETISLRTNTKIFEQELSLFWSTTPNLRCVDLHGCPGVTDTVVNSLLDRCPLLEELDISECRTTEACVMINCAVPLRSMRKLVFGRWEAPFAKEGIDALVSKFPNLVTLDIRTMRPRGIEALESLGRLVHLRHLFTDSVETTGDQTTTSVLQRWLEGIPDLESLQMNACKGVSDFMIQLMRTHPLPSLHTLLLNKCGRVSEQGLRDVVASSGGELCRLECAGYRSVSDKLLMDIKDHCPKIEVLQLANSGQVTGIGLMALVNERGRGLERVCLDDCTTVGVDAVERARTVLGDSGRISHRFHRTHR
ncbi:hypothetical protein BGZ98_000496 [Dissophora globulifera]|nr:hypothetical protein BGZ98_000496 [Dissophora globulifera]